MKNIKEAEAEVGINKQNIRYYEKNGFASSRQKYDKRISEIFRGRYQTAEIHLSVLKTGYAFRRNTKSAGRSN